MGKVIHIGICDDEKLIIEIIGNFCKSYLEENGLDYLLTSFDSGEKVLQYCGRKDIKRIDLLFLDIGLREMDGIAVKDALMKNTNVWRIVFVSGYQERMADSFGLKTIGFVIKPPKQERITKFLEAVLADLVEEQRFIEVRNVGNIKSMQIRLQDIKYIKANGNYTEVYLFSTGNEPEKILTVKKLGEWEKELQGQHIIRIQKSYMVNLAYIVPLKQEVMIKDADLKISVGRTYKRSLEKQYMEYIKERMRK